MHIPRYWAHARLRHETGVRHGATIQRWGWSDDSQSAAEAHARERAQAALDTLLVAPEQRNPDAGFKRIERIGEYGLNGETPIREEVLERRDRLVMTRNNYGARCLNAPDVVIADVDVPTRGWPSREYFPSVSLLVTALPLAIIVLLPGRYSLDNVLNVLWIVVSALVFARNLRRWHQRRRATIRKTLLQAALKRITVFSKQHPDWGLRLYKTPKGLRVIITHQSMLPTDADVQTLFAELQVDSLYARLCTQQQCFRARVSGKPWRMGMNGPSNPLRRWPADEQFADERQRWTQSYNEQATHYSACHFVSQLGKQQIASDIQPLVDWHDAESRAHQTELPMA